MNKQLFRHKVCQVSDIQLCLWSESKHELGRRPSQPARWRRDTWGARRTAATSAAAARASTTGSAASGVTLSGISKICSLLRCHQETPSCCWTSSKSGRTKKMKKTRKRMWPARAVMRQNSKIAKISADPSKCQREHVIPTKVLLKISTTPTKNFSQKFPTIRVTCVCVYCHYLGQHGRGGGGEELLVYSNPGCVLCLYLLIKSAARCCLWGSLDNLFTLATRPAAIITCIDFCKFWDILNIWFIEIVVMY